MNFCVYVSNDPVNFVDPWGLARGRAITRYYPDPNKKTTNQIINEGRAYIDRLNEEYGDIWDAMEETRKAFEPLPEKEESCIKKCFMQAALGNPMHVYNGEVATQLESAIGSYFVKVARKKALKTITVKAGGYLVPGLGYLSSALTAKTFADCLRNNCCGGE